MKHIRKIHLEKRCDRSSCSKRWDSCPALIGCIGFSVYAKLGGSLREPEKLLSWLTTVAKRLYNRERARNKMLIHESDCEYGTDIIENIASRDDDILDEIVRNEDREYITRLVMRLDSKDSSIILLRYKDGMSLKDIALVLDMNYSTVRSMHTRALAKLKEIIDSEKGGRDNG